MDVFARRGLVFIKDQTRISDDKINRIIFLFNNGYQFRGISIKLKEEGRYVSRETVKKVLVIKGLV